jgi:hypothetical protein
MKEQCLKPNTVHGTGDSFLKPGTGSLSTDCGSGAVHLVRRGVLALGGVSVKIVFRAVRAVASSCNPSPEFCPETGVRAVNWGHELLIGCRAFEPFY